MSYDYDTENIFAKIIRGEIPNKTVIETDHTLAFEDIQPRAPHHVLIIPKGPYVSADHFAKAASDEEILDFTRTVGKVCDQLGISLDQGTGFRAISNSGPDGVQEVPHYHLHLLGGRFMGQMVSSA